MEFFFPVCNADSTMQNQDRMREIRDVMWVVVDGIRRRFRSGQGQLPDRVDDRQPVEDQHPPGKRSCWVTVLAILKSHFKKIVLQKKKGRA